MDRDGGTGRGAVHVQTALTRHKGLAAHTLWVPSLGQGCAWGLRGRKADGRSPERFQERLLAVGERVQ